MNHANDGDLQFSSLPDVASARLSELLGKDPALDRAARDLVALLKDAPEVTLGWTNFTPLSTASS